MLEAGVSQWHKRWIWQCQRRLTNVRRLCCWGFRSDKKTLCSDPASARKNGKLPPLAVPPPMPMSPIVEKMEGLKAIRNRSNSLRLGRLAFYQHLEKVETMRCFWELKHVELEGGNHQVTASSVLISCPVTRYTPRLVETKKDTFMIHLTLTLDSIQFGQLESIKVKRHLQI